MLRGRRPGARARRSRDPDHRAEPRAGGGHGVGRGLHDHDPREYLPDARRARAARATAMNPDPLLESARLQEVADLGLTSGKADAVVDACVAEAAAALGASTALISVVLADVQHFAAHYGLEGWPAEVGGTPVEWSFCQHVVRQNKAIAVADARTD